MPIETQKILAHTLCCGVKEMYGVNGYEPDKFCYMVGKAFALENMRAGIITFTSNDGEHGRGERLSDYIQTNKLGTVTPSGIAINPNTQAEIQLYAWIIDMPAILAHYEAYLEKELKKNDKHKEIYRDLRVGACVIYEGDTDDISRGYSFTGNAMINGLNGINHINMTIIERNRSGWIYPVGILNRLKVVYNGQGDTLYSKLKYVI